MDKKTLEFVLKEYEKRTVYLNDELKGLDDIKMVAPETYRNMVSTIQGKIIENSLGIIFIQQELLKLIK